MLILFKLAPTKGEQVGQTILCVTDTPSVLPSLRLKFPSGERSRPSPRPKHVSVAFTPNEARAEGSGTRAGSGLGHGITVLRLDFPEGEGELPEVPSLPQRGPLALGFCC